MITIYLTAYLIFIIAVSLIISLLVLKLKLPSPLLLITLIMIFVVSPLVIGYLYVSYFDSLPEVVVPEVIGAPEQIACRNIEAAGLRARVAGSINEMKFPEGSVVSQRPEAGRLVKQGRMVNLVISSGKVKAKVPNLVGQPFSQASVILAAAGMQWGEVKSETSHAVPEGTILAQEPMAGEEAPVDKPVDLIVATTRETNSVDDQGENDEN